MSASHDFWLSCGHHLLDRDATRKLLVTDEFLKAYLARPELMPPPEACSAERGLHSELLLDPRQPIAASRVAAIADADTRENWQSMIAWRDHLVRYCSLEAAYLEIVRRNIKFPHILICQLVQAILRNALDDCRDVFMLRAAEMLTSEQLSAAVASPTVTFAVVEALSVRVEIFDGAVTTGFSLSVTVMV